MNINYFRQIFFVTLALSIGFSDYKQTQAMQWDNKLIIGVATAGTGVAAYYLMNKYHQINKEYKKRLYWDWDSIDATSINGKSLDQFFKDHRLKLAQQNEEWLWGAGTSAHQVEGDCTQNNWHEWALKPEVKATGVVEAGNACDHWNRYKEDIQLLKKAGLNSYRFSIEWSKVMPTSDTFDQDALNHYKDVCKELVDNGINPLIDLYHYNEPLWFSENDGFAKEENIEHFVRFSKKVFEELHECAHLWLTFNTPEGLALPGWVYGDKPPGKKGQFQTAVEVMKNVLEAHVRIYQELKSMPGGETAKIGFLKNIFQLDPWNACNPLDILACYLGHHLVDTSMYRFLTTGEYWVWIPGKARLSYTNEYIKNGGRCADFIGLNYYCHGFIKNFKRIRDDKQEIPTLNPNYTIYAEGFYRAIVEVSEQLSRPLNVPLYVIENGIGTDSDDDRTTFYQRYMYALARAISDGYEVKGYTTWSLMDNYEWGTYDIRYGLYHVNFDTQERTLKPGSHYYINLIKNSTH